MGTRGHKLLRAGKVSAGAMVGLVSVVLGLPGCDDRREERVPVAEQGPVRAKTLAEAIALAQAGDTIVLPAGTYRGGITLPAGVGLRGAGLHRTILDASGAEIGLTVRGGRGAEVCDLTVRGAAMADLLVQNAEQVAVRRIRTTAGTSGIVFSDVARGRIENVISDGNHEGIVLNGGHDNVVVNCTVTRNTQLGLSFTLGMRMTAFNNCLAEDATAVVLGLAVQEVRLDYNLYASPVVGVVTGQGGRQSLAAWQKLSGQDAHSLQQGVTFRNPMMGDFRPSEEALVREAIVDRGTPDLAGFQAPDHDADNAPRLPPADIGAYEVVPASTAPAPRS